MADQQEIAQATQHSILQNNAASQGGDLAEYINRVIVSLVSVSLFTGEEIAYIKKTLIKQV